MLTPLVSETLIFLVALVFNLIYQRDIQSGLLLLFHNDSARQMAKDVLKDIQVNTSIYFGTLTVVNICLGIAATVLTWLVGLPHPFLWGMLAAVLNFIPYVGAAIVIATLFVVGLLVFPALHQAIIAPLAYLGITALEGPSHHADPHRSSAHHQPIPRFSLHRNLDLDVGTGRRVPGRAHSPVRDGGVASAIIDRRRESRPTRDRCGCPGELMVRAVAAPYQPC